MKNILFITGTRADFGKIKSLLTALNEAGGFNIHIFVTGMHMLKKYGYTCLEVERLKIGTIHKYFNQTLGDPMDVTLANTISGLSRYLRENKIDLVVVHGDRIEALAGATTGSLNNILVAHIEGGEVSGTIDELIRHAVSKMSHIHFVANEDAAKRLVQLGENSSYIKIIGSPDMDIMASPNLPQLEQVKSYYNFEFSSFAILMYHPVTTEYEKAFCNANTVVDAVLESGGNYIVIYPNNDLGSEEILRAYKRFEGYENIKLYPSIRFEYFLTLLKECSFMLGNSSAGVRESPFYGKPSINIGTRQFRRVESTSILNCDIIDKNKIKECIAMARTMGSQAPETLFGAGNSSQLFLKALKEMTSDKPFVQKHFIDLPNFGNA